MPPVERKVHLAVFAARADSSSSGASLPADIPTQAPHPGQFAGSPRQSLGKTWGNQEIHEQIARRAYALWQAEGQPDGRHEEHWYRATREIAAADSKNAVMKRTTRRKSRKT